MKNEVYGTMTMDISVDVESDTEKMAMMEANYKYNDYGLVDCWAYVVDRNGTIHKIRIHNFKIDLVEFIN